MKYRILMLIPCLALLLGACNMPSGAGDKTDKNPPETPVPPRNGR